MAAGRFGNTRREARLAVVATALALAVAAAGCSSSDDASDAPPVSGIAATETTGPGGRPTCNRPVADAPKATPVAGSPRDLDVTSFDGTTIRAHWFPRGGGAESPTILMGPGWGQPGQTEVDAVGLFGALNIRSLNDAGFNVMTWDPRGFGSSTGEAKVDHKDFEGRDVQRLLDWVAAQPGVQTDGAGDPRVGMIGGSYGGGIQLVTAPEDCRVDALVPVIAWSSLETSLFKNETPKSGWANLLTAVTRTRPVDATASRANEAANTTGNVDAADVRWFRDRGPGDAVKAIKVPTLIVQGTVDTLFTLDEAITNYRALRDAGVPVSMMWFCGGHGACLTNTDDAARVERAALAWLKRYVQGEEAAALGSRVDLVDQNGASYAAEDYPLPAGQALRASGAGTLNLTKDGGAGPVTPPASYQREILSVAVLPITPGRAANAVNVPIPVGGPALVVGAPTVELTYSGTVAPGTRPTRVFAQVVDEATGLTLGNQITPIPVTLDGQRHTVSMPLEVVAHAVKADSKLTLQIVATTTAYVEPRLGGSITFEKVDVSLPVAAGVTPKG